VLQGEPKAEVRSLKDAIKIISEFMTMEEVSPTLAIRNLRRLKENEISRPRYESRVGYDCRLFTKRSKIKDEDKPIIEAGVDF